MMTPAQFYANYDAADPFGSHVGRDPNGPGHLGSDFPWPAGTEIPSWVSGTVVRVGFSSAIGYYVVIQRGTGGYALFYHLLEHSALAVGDTVTVGQLVGLVGNTGTLSRGDHLHVGFSLTDPTPGTGAVVDPWPLIVAAITPKRKRSPMSAVLVRTDDSPTFYLWNTATGASTAVSNVAELAKLQEFLPTIGFKTRTERDAFTKKWAPALKISSGVPGGVAGSLKFTGVAEVVGS